MLKLIIIGVLILGLIGAGVYARFTVFNNFFSKPKPSPSPYQVQTTEPVEPVASSSPGVATSSPSSGSTSSKAGSVPTITSASSDTRLRNLEQTVTVLQNRVNQLTSPAPGSSSSSGNSAVYIPLGSGGVQNDQSYNWLQGYEVYINPANYPGYSSMQLEVNFRLVEGGGTASVRLFNNTTNQAVSNAVVSTTSTNYVLAISNGFTLPSGQNDYILQIQSSDNYNVSVQNARIRVNF